MVHDLRDRHSGGTAAIALAAILLLSSLPLGAFGSGVPITGCVAGGFLQRAVDEAKPGGTVIVCAGVWAEELVLWKSITLQGQPGAVLDGSALTGERHALTLAAGVEGVTIRGLEIRKYADPLAARDPSTAILALEGSRGVRLEGNWIHDNAYMGVLAVAARDWVVANSSFGKNGFAHLFLQLGSSILVERNRFEDAKQGVVLAGSRDVVVRQNDFRGGGRGGLIASPAVDTPYETDRLQIVGNAFRGNWEHAMWVLAVDTATITGNTVVQTGPPGRISTGIVIGGPHDDVTVADNVARVFETERASDVPAKFKDRRADREERDRNKTKAQSAWASPQCVGLACLADAFREVVDRLLPSARAQVAVGPVCPAAMAVCDVVDLDELFQTALVTLLNPLADADNADDLSSLAACAGRDDECLRAAFFVADGAPPHEWNVTVDLPNGGRLHFIDAGVRRASDAKAFRHVRDVLDQNWTTLILCRHQVNGTTGPCDAAPLRLEYGLDVTWADSPYSQQASVWRLKLPTERTFDAMDRLHSADATLFKFTSKPHHEGSSPQTGALGSPVPEDPLRTGYAGTLTLRCTIAMPGQLASASPQGCEDPTLVTKKIDPIWYWCAKGFGSQDEADHASVFREAIAHWATSGTCTPLDTQGAQSLTWASLFEPQDMADLAAAQQAYYASPSTSSGAAALQQALTVFERVIARHLAIGIEGEGMPIQVEAEFLEQAVPTIHPSTLRGSGFRTTAVWDGANVVAFHTAPREPFDTNHPTSAAPPHRRQFFDPATGAIAQRLTTGDGTMGTSAIYDGRKHISFGAWTGIVADHGSDCARTESYFPDPVTILGETVAVLCDDAEDRELWREAWLPTDIREYDARANVEVPRGNRVYDLSEASAVWDPRERPADGCPTGCAYLFGGYGNGGAYTRSIAQYDPTSGRLTVRPEKLPIGLAGSAAAWTGEAAYVFGGARSASQPGLDAIFRFDPVTRAVTTMGARFPHPLAFASAAWDGESVLIFGGSDGISALDTIYRYDPATDDLQLLDIVLPKKLLASGAVWDGRQAWIMGGWNDKAGAYGQTIIKAPVTGGVALQDHASAFNAIGLTADAGSESNIVLLDVEVQDRHAGWLAADLAGLVALTPIRATTNATYQALNGELVRADIRLTVMDRPVEVNDTLAISYGGQVLVEVTAKDPDNLDLEHAYADPEETRIHAIPLVNLTRPNGDVLATGLEHVGAVLPLGDAGVKACTTELWTGEANGTRENLADASRLAVQPRTRCTGLLDLDPVLLQYRLPTTISLELRDGAPAADIGVDLSLVHDPYGHVAKRGSWSSSIDARDPRLAEEPSAYDRAVEPIAARVLVTLPRDLLPVEKAGILADLLREYQGTIQTFAVEIDDLPLTSRLHETLETAVLTNGTVVLVGSGRLPAPAGSLAAHDKLMTITGLAASPHVLTIGAGNATHGVSPWSRLGPTPGLLPKPDFVAPSPAGTTGGAVASALPFVEAVVLRGYSHPALVRAALAGFALPTTSQSGAPATYWEQGAGALDLATFVGLSTTPDLLEQARAYYGDPTIAETTMRLANALGTTPAVIEASAPQQLLGVALTPTALIRVGNGMTLLNLTIDSPAFPASPFVDFGVVNHQRPGEANFTAFDYDGILNATAIAARVLLEEAGYTGTALDEATGTLLDLVHVEASSGQEITRNVTHYALFDLVSEGDYLYTTYARLLDAQLAALDGAAVDADAVAGVRSTLDPWLLEGYGFVDEARTTIHLNATTETSCRRQTLSETESFSKSVLEILGHEADRMFTENARAEEARAIYGEAETFRESFLVERRIGFAESQLDQLLCLDDQKRLLEGLRAWTQAMRDLRAIPAGAWDQTEASTGAWDQTALGGAIANATATLGLEGEEIAQGGTLLLDTVLEAIDRSRHLLDQKLNFTAIPSLRVDGPRGPDALRTDPSRTREAPLGPYVGLATLTSHGVTTYDPLTGRPFAKRDLTVPVPSFLFNNPDFVLDEAWSDNSSYAGALAVLFDGDGSVVDRATIDTVDATTTPTGRTVKVQLDVDPAPILAAERAALLAQRARILELRANASEDALGLVPYDRTFQDVLEGLDASIAARLDALNASDAGTRDVDLAALNLAVSGMYSRLAYQAGVLDGQGQMTAHNLFPGVYNLYSPYPFFTRFLQDQDHPYRNPGDGAFAGPIQDAGLELAKHTRGIVDVLTTHGTAEADPSPVDPLTLVPGGSLTGLSTYETQTHDFRFIPANQFGIEVAGADYLDVACLDAQRFGALTATRLAFPGCGAPALAEGTPAIRRANGFARCLQGDPYDPMEASNETECAALRGHFERNAKACQAWNEDALKRAVVEAQGVESPACRQADAYRELVEAARNLSAALVPFEEAGRTLRIPWARSPARALAQDPAAFGYTEAAVLERSLPLNAGTGATEAEVRSAVRDALASLGAPAGGAVAVVEPPRTGRYDHTLAPALVSHVTDRVSGLDWTHVETADWVPGAISATDVRDRVVAASRDLFDPGSEDHAAATTFLRALERVRTQAGGAAEIEGRFRSGIVGADAVRLASWSDGWRANGTVSRDGLGLAGVLQPGPGVPVEECFANATARSALQRAYLNCRTMGRVNYPDLTPYEGIDLASFAAAMLELSRLHPETFASETPDPGVVLGVLERATARSVSGPGLSWIRTQEAIHVETAAASPAIGLLVYGTPVAESEYLAYRIDAELLLENTAALVITTANPAVTDGVLRAIQTLEMPSPANASDEPYAERVAGAVLGTVAVIHDEVALRTSGRDTLTRVELLGMPVAVEQQYDFAEGSVDGVFGRGVVTVRSDNYHNYTRWHEMDTKYRGVTELSTIIAYFPTVPLDGADPVPQKLQVLNYTVELQTFLGLGGFDNARETGFTGLDTRLAYRDNVEDYNLLFSIPDQPVRGLDVPDGMRVGVTGPHASLAQVPTLRGVGPDWTYARPDGATARGIDPEDLARGSCLRNSAPGFWQGNPLQARMIRPVGGGPVLDLTSECDRNAIEGLRAVHKATRSPQAQVAPSDPGKSLLDALDYVVRVGPGSELHSHAEARGFGGPLPSPAEMRDFHESTQHRPPSPLNAVWTVRQKLDEAGVKATHALHEGPGPSAEMAGITPFVHPSFLPEAQSGGAIEEGALDLVVLHNFVHLRNAEALELAGNGWLPSNVRFGVWSEPSLKDVAPAAIPDIASAQRMTGREESLYRAVVAAYDHGATIVATDGLVVTETRTRTFSGNGVSGAGIAVDLRRKESWTLSDGDEQSFADGSTLATATTYELRAYALGGDLTAGSRCEEIPLYEDVHPHFRCIGYTDVLVEGEGSAILTQSCAAAAEGVLDRGRVLATSATKADAQRRHFSDASGLDRALRRLATEGIPPELDVGARAQAAARHLEDVDGLGVAVAGLLQCVQVSREVSLPAISGDVVDATACLLASVRSAWTLADVAAASQNARCVTAELTPENAIRGESARALRLATTLTAVGEAGATKVTGPITVTFSAEDVRANLTRAWMNLTTTPPGGAPSTATLGELVGRPNSTIETGSAHITLLPLHTYHYRLTALDEFGQATVATGSFLVDDVLPTVVPSATNVAYANAATATATLAFVVADPESGLKDAQLQVFDRANASWRDLGPPIPASQIAAQGGVVEAAIALPTFHLQAGGLKAIVRDVAGNVREGEPAWVTKDRAAPVLSGAFPDAVSSIIASPQVNATFAAADSVSGLATWSAWLYDATTGERIDLSPAASASGPFVGGSNAWTGRLNHHYLLNVSATDAVGNAATRSVASARVEQWVQLTSLVPLFQEQGAGPRLHFALNATLPGFPDEVPSNVTVRVTHESDTKRLFPVFEKRIDAPSGSFRTWHAWWNATSSTPSGEYDVDVTGRRGRTVSHLVFKVNLTQPAGGIVVASNSTRSLVGSLEGGADPQTNSAVYAFTYPRCGSSFTLRLQSLDHLYGESPHDVEMHVTNWPPSDPRDPAAYVAHADGPAPRQSYTWVGAAPDEVYYVLVTHRAATRTDFDLHFDPGCWGAPDGRVPSENTQEPALATSG